MYINVGKLFRILGYIVSISVILLGVVISALSHTAEEQSSGTLAAIFGLLLVWFVVWLGRE